MSVESLGAYKEYEPAGDFSLMTFKLGEKSYIWWLCFILCSSLFSRWLGISERFYGFLIWFTIQKAYKIFDIQDTFSE